MSRTEKFKHPLLVQKPFDNMSAPQKCKIPQNIDFPASSMIIAKSGHKKFLCRLYYLSEVYDDKRTAFIDDSVEINPAKNDSSANEIKWLHEIELVTQPPVYFKEIKVRLQLDINELNFAVIKHSEDLIRATKSTLKHYRFCADSDVRCKRNGISKAYVVGTNATGFGSIDDGSIVEIMNISFDSHSLLGRKPLGGLEEAGKALESAITSSINFMRYPQLYSTKPSGQALIVGPVGVGKTSLVHQVADKLHCVIFELTSDVFRPLPGETECAIQETFAKLKAITRIVGSNQAVLLLIENIEIFCPKFNSKMKENSNSSRISSLVLALLDDISESESALVVVGTTSKLESLDVAVRRSSRMGKCEILLDMPDEAQRLKIIKKLCNQMTNEDVREDVLSFVSQSTPGFVGADLEVLCQFVSRFVQSGNLELNEANIQQAFEQGLKSITPSVMRENLGLVTKSSLKLDSIAGMDELKKSLLTSVLGPLQHPEKFLRLGLRSPSGILLYGPSGCAKTTFVKCLAGESKMTLISASSAEIYSPYVGEAEKFIVKLFNQARMNAPSILFFDEIDTIVGNRSVGGGGSDAHTRILSTLLTEIDGFGTGSKKTVLIIGSTNKPHMIDDALMRPGRFDKLIHVPAPDRASRLGILKFTARKMPIDHDVDLERLADDTQNFSGADLFNLCNEAALTAATKDLNSNAITRDDFDDVLAYLGPSLSESQIEFYANYENSHRQKA